MMEQELRKLLSDVGELKGETRAVARSVERMHAAMTASADETKAALIRHDSRLQKQEQKTSRQTGVMATLAALGTIMWGSLVAWVLGAFT